MEVHMANRLMALLGLAVVLAAMAAAMLAGAATAAAETRDGDATKSSESQRQSSPKTEPGANGASSSAGSRKTEAESGEAEHSSTGHDTTDSDKPDGDAGAQTPEASPPSPSQEDADGSAVNLTGLPTDKADDSKTARPMPKNNKPHTDEPTSGRTGTADTPGTDASAEAVAAPTADEPASASHETSAMPAESNTAAALEPAVVENTPSQAEVHEAATVAMSARSTVAVTDQASAPRAPTLVDFIGSIVLNVVMGLIHTFDGAPVLPAGSNVTVRTSTLTIPVARGRTVEADWYFLNDGPTPTRLIYLQHGLGASAPLYSYTAATLAEQTHSIVVAPSLTSNFFDSDGAWLGGTPMQVAVADMFVGDREALTESASAAAGYEVTLPKRFVLAGHSLGGSLVMGAAGYMVDNGAIADLAGVLLLDSVDVNNTVPTALQKLTGTNYRPVLDISAERYVWNMYGRVGDELEAARPGQFNGVMLVGGRHIDALQGGNPLLQISQYLVAGFSQPQNIEAVKTLAVGWVNDMFAGTHDGIYGVPQQSIQIDTSAGAATAVVLPFTSTQTVQATPFDGLLSVVLDFLAQNLFVYEPLAGRPSTTATATAV
jgi:pimeloyl-ACP methyl ester carboxylesterase